VQILALHLVETVAPFQHAIEFIDHQGNRLVAFIGGDGGIEIGPEDIHMAFGDESIGHGLLWITFQLHADADYSLLVPKQSLHFFTDERFKRLGEFEVNAGDDQFVLVVLAVHDYVVVLV